jgi:uncharacterized alpha-E superfamily protein
MLSRTAEHLYWMSRYFERAANMARILEACYRIALLPPMLRYGNSEWEAALNIVGAHQAYNDRYKLLSSEGVINFLGFDLENPSSLRYALWRARENAKSVRAFLPAPFWELINTAWMEVKNAKVPQDIFRGDIFQFFEWAKERAQLFRGVAYDTLLHNESFDFVRLGMFIECADNTARILDVKYHILLPDIKEVGGAIDYYQWSSLLESVGALDAYYQLFPNNILPWNVAELLILRVEMPRSLRASIDQVSKILERLSLNYRREAVRIAGKISSILQYGDINEIFQTGLHEFLSFFLAQIIELGYAINRDFFSTQWYNAQTQTQTSI